MSAGISGRDSRQSQSQRRLGRPRPSDQTEPVVPSSQTSPLCADIDGFSLHAAVCCGADDDQALEHFWRCITSPTLANEPIQTNAGGKVVPKPTTDRRDGAMHSVTSRLEFMHQLAALVIRLRPATSSSLRWPLEGSCRASNQ